MSNDVDPLWRRFTRVTRARIGLGRVGDALPTEHLLAFQYAHACARDAVMAQLDFDAMAAHLRPWPTLRVRSDAGDRSTFLRRPDRGRRMAAGQERLLEEYAAQTAAACAPVPSTGHRLEAVFVIADGLSAGAVRRHAIPMFEAAAARLPGWRLGPVVLAEQARVALGDEIGARLGAAISVVLIGERPGLTVPNSLGIYITYAPAVGRRDAERNCISNIHDDGLTYAAAADKLVWLMNRASSLRLTGVGLKEDAPATASKLVDNQAAALPCSGQSKQGDV